jgi:hypothetical protein
MLAHRNPARVPRPDFCFTPKPRKVASNQHGHINQVGSQEATAIAAAALGATASLLGGSTARAATIGGSLLVRDRAGQLTDSVKISLSRPQTNAFAERFVLTARTEVTDRTLIFGQRHLRAILAHYNGRRPHRSHQLHSATRPPSPNSGSSAVPPPAASPRNTSAPHKSPDQHQ